MDWCGRTESTNVATAVQDNTHDLALLYFGELELRESLACVDVVLSSINHEHTSFFTLLLRRKRTHLATHKHHKHAPPNIRVHALLLRELYQHIFRALDGFSLRLGFLSIMSIHKGVTGPRGADEPPFAFAVGGVEVGEGDAEGFV